MMMMMSLEDAQKRSANKHHFYKGMKRIGWYLPDYKCKIVTWDFIM